MEPIITVNQYPIGWEWLDRVPLEDFNWLIEIFSTMTDNTDTYDFVFYEDSETLPGHLKRICSVDKIPLANFLNEEAYLTKKFIYRMNLIIILLVYAFIQVYLIE